MYIQAVNSNSDKINFGAKYKIGGFTNFIPKDTLNELSGKLANFGTESDAVIIHVGPKEYTKSTEYLLGLVPRKVTRYSRAIFAISNVNGQQYDRNLSYRFKKEKFDEIKYFDKVLKQYISELSALLKK